MAQADNRPTPANPVGQSHSATQIAALRQVADALAWLATLAGDDQPAMLPGHSLTAILAGMHDRARAALA